MTTTADIICTPQRIQSLIHDVRGRQVMIDRDLAALYGVETRVLIQATKRNPARFPQDFMFQMNTEEFAHWKSQIVMSKNDKIGLRRPPYVFTEQGVAMLSAVLKSATAVEISVAIVRAFVMMRQYLTLQTPIAQELADIKERIAALECSDRDNTEHIDDIYMALTELAKRQKQIDNQQNRPKIGFKINEQQ